MDGRKIGEKQQNILNILSDYLNARLLEKEVLAENILSEYEMALSPYNELFQMKNVKKEIQKLKYHFWKKNKFSWLLMKWKFALKYPD